MIHIATMEDQERNGKMLHGTDFQTMICIQRRWITDKEFYTKEEKVWERINNFGIKDVYVNIKKVAFAVNKPDTATGVQLEVYNAKNRSVLSKTARTMGYESMNVSKDMAYKYRARYYYTNDSNNQTYYGKWSDYRYFAMPSISGKTTNKKKGIKVVLKKGTYYVQVVPKVKFGNKSYSSDVVTVASAYVYK